MPAASIAYTSSVAMAGTPPVPQTDKVITYASLPLAPVSLFAAGIDPGDAGAAFTYLWSVVDQPVDAGALFSDATSATPTFGPISAWGNYRLMCVVTSNGVGGASSSSYVSAPKTAFVTLRVKSALLSLEKPAKFERDWQVDSRQAIQKAEDTAYALANQTIAKHDVSTATGALLDLLCDGSLAESAPGVALHVHGAGSMPLAKWVGAAPSQFGAVKLAELPVDALEPLAINVERLPLTAFVDGTPTAIGYLPGVIKPPVVVVGTIRAHCRFYCPEALKVTDWSVALEDGGLMAGTYTFKLYVGTAAEWAAGTPTDTGLVVTGSAGADNVPMTLTQTGQTLAVLAARWLGIVCTAAPASPGGQMTGTVMTHRGV